MGNPYLHALERLLHWLRRSFGVLWLVIMVAYFCVLAGRAFYKNYQEQQALDGLQKQLVAATVQRDRLQALLVYYRTDDYRELALRQDLLLQKPGERVYALPESSATQLSDEDVTVRASLAIPSKPSVDPFWKQWEAYLLRGEKGA